MLDTSVLLGPDPGPFEAEVAISAVSLAELHFGVHGQQPRVTPRRALFGCAAIEPAEVPTRDIDSLRLINELIEAAHTVMIAVASTRFREGRPEWHMRPLHGRSGSCV